MRPTFEQPCPLCLNSAKYMFKDAFNLKYFSCNTCNEFVISRVAEKHLSDGVSQWRIALSEMVKHADEKRIYVIKTSDTARKTEGFAFLKNEFVEPKHVGRCDSNYLLPVRPELVEGWAGTLSR